MTEGARVVVVGAGLAGLSCAVRLQECGARPIVLEASERVGGRVCTDEVGGFLLDRGFQVFLDAYPNAGRRLDKGALDLRKFRPGALLFDGRSRRRVMDVFRCPQHLIGTALRGVGSFRDKLLIAKLRSRLKNADAEELLAGQGQSTIEYLRDFGFSERMIDQFFRPFYGGIFLERDLRTSSGMFEFTFKMFAEGAATLPADGMRSIPEQLAARLRDGTVLLGARVRSIGARGAVLESGERVEGDALVVAADGTTAAALVPASGLVEPGWRAVTGLYFAAPRSPLDEAIIALNKAGSGLVNNVCVPSDVAPRYAPEGQSLVSVSVLGEQSGADLPSLVKAELGGWFGGQVEDWRHLRTDRIRRALPEQLRMEGAGEGFRRCGDVVVCGDHCSSASIEGAIDAMREGAFHYIPKPFKNEEVLLTIRQGLERRRLASENRELRAQLRQRYAFDNILGKSKPMTKVFELIQLAAPNHIFTAL